MIDMGSAQGSIKLSASDFLSAIDKSIEKLNRLKQQSKGTSDAVEKVGVSVTNTTGKVDELTNKTDGLDNAQEDAKDSAKDLGKEVDNLGDREKDTSGDTEELGKKTQETEEKTKSFADTLQGVGSKLQEYGTKISKAGTNLTKYVTTPIIAAAGYATKVTTTFESGMSTVRAISGASDEEMEQLTSKAQEMGKTTVFSATQATDALKYMAMAGWKTEDMLDGISGVMALAAASGDDLASTSDIVTDALTAFGLTAKDSAHFADVLAAASNNSNTNVSMLGESFKYCAPIAGTFGYTIEDMTIALGLMANNGIKASQAGTTLRSAFTRLAKPTKDMQGILDDMGISLTDAQGNMKPLRELFGSLREGFSKLNAEEQAEAATILFGKTAMSGMLAVLRTSEDDYNKLAAAIDGAEGSATRMSEVKLDNFQGQLTLLKSNLESVGIQFGKLILPYLQKLVSGAGGLLDWLGKLDDKTKGFIITAGGLLAALGPVLKIIGNVTKAAGGLSKGLSLLVAHPVVAAVALISAGLIALTTSLVNNIEAVDKDYNAYQEFSDRIRATSEEFKNLKDARQKSVSDSKSEFDHYAALKTELDKIVDANGKVKTGYEDRAKFITNELSQALGIEIENNGKVIKNYQTLSSEIDKLIEKQRSEAMLAAYKESYAAAIKNQTQAQKDLYTATEHRNEQLEKVEKTEKRIADLTKKIEAIPSSKRSWFDNSEFSKLSIERSNAQEELKQYQNQLSNANTDWQRAQNTYSDYITTIHNYEELSTALVVGNEKKVKEATTNMVNDLMTATTGTQSQLIAQRNEYKEHYESLKRLASSGSQQVSQAVLNEAADLYNRSQAELDKYYAMMAQGGVDGVTRFASGINKETNSPAFLSSISGAFSKTFPTLKKSGEDMGSTFLGSLSKKLWNKSTGISKIGSDFVQGFCNAIKIALPGVGGVVALMAGQALNTLKTKLDSHSPSRETAKYGKWFVQGFAQGITSNVPIITDAVNTMTQDALDMVSSPIKGFSLDMSGMGEQVPYLVQGQSGDSISSSDTSISKQYTTSNVYNFYSPEPIDAVKATNQFKQVQKQLAEGFV